MKKFRVLAVALAAAALLAGCGGNEAGDQSPRVTYSRMINFGDSLSDVGSYAVGAVALQGGGHFSINGQGATGLLYINWTEFLAAQLQLTQPCAAETGLNTIQAVVKVPPVAATFHDTGTTPCLNYAQGGARVTNPVGPGNALLFNAADTTTYSDALGLLTVPVQTQIQNYLAHATSPFPANSLVTVMAGANDVFINLAVFQATVTAGGNATTAATAAVTAVVTAADELANAVNTQLLAKGADHVIVINIPDASITPTGIAAGTAGQALMKQMLQAFNAELATKLQSGPNLLLVDAFTESDSQAATMAQHGLTDVTTSVCTTSSSLVCTKSTLIAAVAPASASAPASGANTYEYADGVHPTPYGYRLLAELVAEKMSVKGWL